VLEKSHIDCIATKSYRPNGVVVMIIYFRGTFYACLSAGDENQPLLDSAFPSIVRSKGYQIKTYPSGIDGWPGLRKLSLWRNGGSVTPSQSTDQDPENINAIHLKEEGNSPKDAPCDEEDQAADRKAMETKDEEQAEGHKDTDTKECVQEKGEQKNIDQNDRSSKPNRSEPKQKPSSTHIAESKSGTETNVGNRATYQRKGGLGAFHHLAPLKKPSKLEQHVKHNKNHGSFTHDNDSPWDSEGRPISTN
jgi:hypothetical protein